MTAAFGFTLQPDDEFLELLGGLIEEQPQYYEVAPETLWFRRDGQLRPNGFHRRFLELAKRTRRRFVAHGVGFSLGTAAPEDRARKREWLRQLGEDQKQFRFRWYTDHLGATSLGGKAVTLPLPLPMTRSAAAIVRRQLRQLQSVVPNVGIENNVAYFLLGDSMEEPAFFEACLQAPRMHLLLDLHNVHTMAVNFGFDPAEYLSRIDLSRVIEIHLSGGSSSDARWLPSGREMRLDSHASEIPDEVWRLFEAVLPKCRRLKGVTLERMEGTVTASDVPILQEEARRIRRMLEAA